ncbi:MAG: cytochrome b/b6 domain-containing protein [Rhodoferax sp.]|uniref:cytochrome b/b6 domain-containing protein n=1 Tax=Rhodoferax sp. TaxID=50421 RepID=UPI00260A7111|nr:cytochrome b/b6 domain-containing protein [Rhodoferax sp.]MDD2881150.1 cytochrome b/b6 domain-containing protein [Rhodoferax sp.]
MRPTLIWDLPTRLFHWALASSFALAWLTSDSDPWLAVHVFVGYLMLGLVGFRLVWGLVGSHFSRFASFWFGPKAALEYLKQVAKGRAPRHVGHNPTGSLAIYILLGLSVLVGLTGVLTLGGDEQQGLAAGWFSFAQARILKELHELGAIAMLVVVIGHITGVVVESLLHKENLARSMVTGFKQADAGTPKTNARPLVAVLMLLAMLGFGGWWFTYAIDRQIDTQTWNTRLESGTVEEPHVKFVGKQLPDNPQWRDECGSCHNVFYPALLPARSWQKMMTEQDKHFGTDLGFDKATSDAILKFMVDNAAEKHAVEAAYKIEQSIAATDTPLRVTETPYWVKKHREIAASDWANPLVKSKTNCAACHSDADNGTFEDGAMHIPAAPKAVTSAAVAAPVPAASKP